MSEPVSVDIYFDYACPFAYAAAVWMRDVQEQRPGALKINWCYFSLEQVNQTNGEDWKIWDQPDDTKSRSVWSFRGSEAARKQGNDAFERFMWELIQMKHVSDQPHGRKQTILEAARRAGLDEAAFEGAMNDRASLAKLAEDHQHATSMGIFGTPTIVFPDGSAAYIQVRPAPPAAESLTMFDDFVYNVRKRPYFHEFKRPGAE